MSAPSCRICGCTDDRACVTDDGPCMWVRAAVCSACWPKLPAAEKTAPPVLFVAWCPGCGIVNTASVLRRELGTVCGFCLGNRRLRIVRYQPIPKE